MIIKEAFKEEQKGIYGRVCRNGEEEMSLNYNIKNKIKISNKNWPPADKNKATSI